MRLKRASIIGGITLGVLLIIISVILYNFIGPGAKEIKASKEFISKLYSISAISNEQTLESVKYKLLGFLYSESPDDILLVLIFLAVLNILL